VHWISHEDKDIVWRDMAWAYAHKLV